jgi:hypothetical protein
MKAAVGGLYGREDKDYPEKCVPRFGVNRLIKNKIREVDTT